MDVAHLKSSDLKNLAALEAAAVEGDLDDEAAYLGAIASAEHAVTRASSDLKDLEDALAALGASTDPASWRLLGKLRIAGIGRPRNPEAARYWLERAAGAGDAASMIDLAGHLFVCAARDLEDGGAASNQLQFDACFWFARALFEGQTKALNQVAAIIELTPPDVWKRAVEAAVWSGGRMQ